MLAAPDDTEVSEMYCKNCGLVEPMPADAPKRVSHMAIGGLDVDPSFYLSKHMKADPTLPHLSSIPCVNKSECPGETNDVVYVKYDAPNMRYVYMCMHCDAMWKN
jgi:hypothetical protein